MKNPKTKHTRLQALLLSLCTAGLSIAWMNMYVYASCADTSGTVQNPEVPYTEAFGNVEFSDPVYSIYEDGSVQSIDLERDIPVSYDSRLHGRVSPVKYQVPWNNCWCFSSMAALESSMASAGYASSDIDLSEYHLGYYVYRSITDPLGGTAGDSVSFNGSFEQFLGFGGNVLAAYHALTNWAGAVDQSFTGYPTSNPKGLPDTVESAYFNDTVHLQQMYRISRQDKDAIKQEIMTHGAVTAGFYYNGAYMNPETGAYFTRQNVSTNHGVTIVGWDDAYSRDNFVTRPSHDGAWLVKNSWGTSFGQDGYLWLSYEDASIEDTMCVLVGEPADNYDYNYQYDGSYMNNYLSQPSNISTANVFRVPDGHTAEELKAVSFELGSTNTFYSIQVYTGLEDPARPDSGTPGLQEPLFGQTKYQGYYTVSLPETVLLEPGETFSIVIEYNKNDIIRPAVECSDTWNRIQFTASAKAGQSFLSTDGGENWMDAGVYYNGNLRIKAFTSRITPPDGVLALEPSETDLTVGESFPLAVFINGVKQPPENNSEYAWSVDRDGIVSLGTDGTLLGLSAGTCTVTCSSRINLLESASATITIRSGFEDIRTTDWAYPFVMNVYGRGIMVGNGSNLFGTENQITRGEFVTVLYNCAGRPAYDYKPLFSDAKEDDWYAVPIVWAYENGIASGYGNGEFGSLDAITREQMGVMLYHYGMALEKDVSFRPGSFEHYGDSKDVSGYAENAMNWAVNKSILVGRGDNLVPKGLATRGECATVITKFLALP